MMITTAQVVLSPLPLVHADPVIEPLPRCSTRSRRHRPWLGSTETGSSSWVALDTRISPRATTAREMMRCSDRLTPHVVEESVRGGDTHGHRSGVYADRHVEASRCGRRRSSRTASRASSGERNCARGMIEVRAIVPAGGEVGVADDLHSLDVRAVPASSSSSPCNLSTSSRFAAVGTVADERPESDHHNDCTTVACCTCSRDSRSPPATRSAMAGGSMRRRRSRRSLPCLGELGLLLLPAHRTSLRSSRARRLNSIGLRAGTSMGPRSLAVEAESLADRP